MHFTKPTSLFPVSRSAELVILADFGRIDGTLDFAADALSLSVCHFLIREDDSVSEVSLDDDVKGLIHGQRTTREGRSS